ncbi:cytosine permease [Corynebacterium sp. sy017]|uniref:cytosine permease n=1 Tax=unclassified Corynebacterium TaxID=2624378 RepID=UPI001185ED1A|nr:MULTISPECIES: cytosine permease [unclassified Corynebacterium]MBP3089407.1 cytosine permease [Corynebacterium sp. sy017]QDZ43332.1 cytosine permease [Corynebacterium sp. sy039]TSD90906.1 cytosine permease [Corynebacterium sp. SY003]
MNSAKHADPDYPVTPVPVQARKTFFSLVVVLLGFTVFTPTMISGAELGVAFRFSELLMVVGLGSLILGAYVATLGWVGARTGLTTVVMARYTLGTHGAKVASLLLGGTQLGWYGVIIGTVGSMTAQAFGWQSYGAQVAVMIISSTLMCLTACYGYRGMYWVSAITTPLILVLAVWVVYKCVDKVGGWSGLFALEPGAQLSLAVAITTVVGTFVSAGTQAPNWTRFAKSGTHAVLACVIGFIFGNGLMIFFGAIGAMTFGEGDFVVILYQLGLVSLGLFLLFGNLWKSNADTAYAFGVAGAEIFGKNRKAPFVVAGSVVGTVFAILGVHNHLIDFLYLLGVFIPPLGGVIIGDYVMRWRRTQMPTDVELPRYYLPNLLSYVVAAALAYGSTTLGIGIPPLVGIFSAILAVVVAHCVRS